MSRLKVIFPGVFMLFSLTGYGQSGLFVNPYFGGGFSDIITTGSIPNAQKTISLTSGGIGVNVGYKTGKLIVTTGINFFNTGNETEDFVIFQNLSAPYEYDSGRVSYSYRHIALPLKVGYTVIDRKVSLTPELGIMLAYTLGQWTNFNSLSGNQGRTDKMPADTYNNLFQSVSVFGTADILMAIHFNDKIALTLSPVFSYMLTNLQKLKGPTIGVKSQRHYAATFNIGIMFSL